MDWHEFEGVPRAPKVEKTPVDGTANDDDPQIVDGTTDDKACNIGLYDLRAWSRMVPEFDVVGFASKHVAEDDRSERAKGGLTITCPFEAEHTQPGGTGTFCDNADANGHPWIIRCSHNACAERKRLDHLKGWLDDKECPITIEALEAHSGVKVPLVAKVDVADFDTLIATFDNKTSDEQLSLAVAMLCRIDDEFTRASAQVRLLEAAPKRVTEEVLAAAIKKEQQRIAATAKALKAVRAEWAREQHKHAVDLASLELCGRFKWILDAGGYWDMDTGQLRPKADVYDDVLSVLDAKNLKVKPREALLMDEESKFIRIGYRPAGSDVYMDDKGRRTLNTYIAPTLKPKEGDASPMLRHIEYIFGRDLESGSLEKFDAKSCKHFLDYIAFKVQNPATKILHAVLIGSKQGVGRSTIATKVLKPIFGEHNVVEPTHDELMEGRNVYLERKQVVIVHEIFDVENSRDLSYKMKPNISELWVRVRKLYLEHYEIENLGVWIMFTNHYNALFIESGDRRYFMFDSPAKPMPPEYYDKLHDWLDNQDGAAIFLNYLQQRDVSDFNANAPAPMTAAKKGAIAASKGETIEELEELFEDGKAPFDKELFNLTEMLRKLRDGRGLTKLSRPRLVKFLEERGAQPLEEWSVRFEVRNKEGGLVRDKARLWALRNTAFWRASTDAQRGLGYVRGYTADQARAVPEPQGTVDEGADTVE